MRTSLFFMALGVGLLSACSGEPAAPVPAATLADSQDTVVTIVDVTARATVMPTAMLGSLVAEKYGIRRADDQIMLLVGLRRGEGSAEVSVPANVVATVSDLRGGRRPIELRELSSGELMDYVGTVAVSLPDTLKFEIDITLADGARNTMQFTREFQPQ
ncbi:DUF4426 domain-containing protein [Lysobacter sp. H21R4]|uniref:DUF4426 domain-containing protein n=1 Tax=Lysobacter sp. H21R4 TaxID=2781021 RepID=UPI0018880FE8|nr:DUF4426 domain-containing protein [Lysobacter sp. H21R4]QOY62233.1 DUF4426 domain-containing protein [Lysobacter sp. H21R4]